MFKTQISMHVDYTCPHVHENPIPGAKGKTKNKLVE